MTYRGYVITKERWDGETVIWVGTPEGPFDAPSVRRAKEYIDAMVEEDASLAEGQPMSANQ